MTTMYPVDPRDLERITRELLDETPNTEPDNPPSEPAAVASPQDYIQLQNQGRIILVSKYKLGMNKEVEAAGKRLGLILENSAQESNGRGYIGNINWATAMKLNLSLGDFTLGIKDYMAFLQLLKLGKAVDGNGRQISSDELLALYNEITKKKDPYRVEWLDADFKVVGSALTMHYNHTTNQSGNLNPRNSETLESHIAKNCYTDLTPLSKQGLPTKKSKMQEYKQGDNVYFWHPLFDNNSVAWFGASSGGVYLYCSSDPTDSGPGLGVRRAKIFHRK